MCVIVSQDAKLYVLTQPWDIELFHLTKSLSHIFQKKIKCKYVTLDFFEKTGLFPIFIL